MSTLVLSAVLVVGVVVLTPTADRLRVPLPVLLTLFGLALPLVPGTPGLQVEPELILPVVLPPCCSRRPSARPYASSATRPAPFSCWRSA